jgi:hypothetical protein
LWTCLLVLWKLLRLRLYLKCLLILLWTLGSAWRYNLCLICWFVILVMLDFKTSTSKKFFYSLLWYNIINNFRFNSSIITSLNTSICLLLVFISWYALNFSLYPKNIHSIKCASNFYLFSLCNQIFLGGTNQVDVQTIFDMVSFESSLI